MDHSSVEILESMSDGVVAIDREWRYTYVNRAAEHNAGLRRDEMLGRRLWEVFHEFTGSQFESACRRAMDEGVTVHFEEYCAPLDRWFEHAVYPAADGLTVYARDVTERRLAEEAGRRSHEELRQRVAERTRHLAAINEDLIRQISERERVEEELRRANETVTEILESITDAFCAFDQDWHYTYVNERATQMLGKSRDQLIGRSALELFPEFEGREDYHKCQQAMQEHAPVYFESFSPVFDRWVREPSLPNEGGRIHLLARHHRAQAGRGEARLPRPPAGEHPRRGNCHG